MQNRRGLFAGMQSGRLSGFVPYKGTKDLPNAGRISRFIRNFVDMKVALCQFSMEWEAAARNLRRAEELVAQAGADLALLPEMFAPGEISRLYINFPDPWPKKRHASRRFINPDNLKELARILKKGGILRVATDHKIYKGWTLRQLHENPDFRWTATCGNDWKHEPADWVETKYQRKAIREGRRPVFLDFERL